MRRPPRSTPQHSSSTLGPPDLARLARTEPDFWVGRLIQRKYTDEIRLISGPEYSAQIEHDATRFFFPLGSADPQAASLRAAEIYSGILRDGWPAAFSRWPREITIAVFWCWSPMACTYTTLYTLPQPAPRPRTRSSSVAPQPISQIGIVEPDPGVANALAQCIQQHPGFACAARWQSGQAALQTRPPQRLDLLLVNRSLAEHPGDDLLDQLHHHFPRLPVFTFGVYEESNYIFHSVAGVQAGYVLHRRPPGALLEPASRRVREEDPSRGSLAADIKKYFQGLFDLPSSHAQDPELTRLTRRERDILNCLSQGRTDKEISDALGISVWTVHGHVKKVFEKLRVHSRTEAVVKYLQK